MHGSSYAKLEIMSNAGATSSKQSQKTTSNPVNINHNNSISKTSSGSPLLTQNSNSKSSISNSINRPRTFSNASVNLPATSAKLPSTPSNLINPGLNLSINAYNLLAIKNKLLCDLTRAIQLVQKAYLEKENGNQPLTNSDYQVHELCQQFDYCFLYGLKNQQESYWKVVLEFTHKNVINDLKRLLNVTTSFGLSRAWIYHALNDNLMESYLKCFLDNKKLVERYYKKDASLMSDEQAMTVLSTLTAGLENVEFKLQNDVPYLDHSCWPTHLSMKRQVVDVIMNSSPQSLSQLVDLSSSLNDSSQSTQSSFGIKIDKQKINDKQSLPLSTSLANTSTNLSQNKKKVKKANISTSKRITNRPANNISFDNNSSASSDLNSNLNDESSETSGRYTAVSANLMNTSPNQSSDYFTLTETHNNSESGGNKALDNLVLLKNNNRKTKYHKKQSIKTNQESNNDSDDELDRYNNSNSFNSNEESSIIMDKMVGLSVKTTSTSTANTLVPNYYDQHKIDNEINKLRKESGMFNNTKNDSNDQNDSVFESKSQTKSKKLISSSSTLSQTTDHSELADSSLKASNHFDNKIKHIENYSQIIEKATLEMDACVKDMNIVYENYEKIVGDENEFDDMSNGDHQNRLAHSSVYDMVETKVDIYNNYNDNLDSKKEINDSSNPTNKLEFYLSSTSSIQTNVNNVNNNNNNNLDDNSSYKFDKDFDRSSQATSTSTKYSNENENYLDCVINVNELKQDIKVDNNTKLMLAIDIFQNGHNEEFVKLYHATQGHSQGEIEAINLLITSYGIYILKRKEISENGDKNNSPTNSNNKFDKQLFINHNQMDYIEVSLGDQSIHFVCINKRQNTWITSGSRKLTENILDNLQTSRQMNKSLKNPKIQIFHEATQQKLAIKKFISTEENLSPQDIELNSYSLVYWEDQASAINHLIHKEGHLLYYHKTSGSGSLNSAEWKKAYFVLKNDILTQYKSSHDKRPTNVIKLNGEDFAGCRKNTSSPKANTIELILSNSNVLYLVAKSEIEASDWLQCFCKIISLGNYHTDVPSHSCLPCCSVITSNRIYFCHEDLNSGFYRLLESIKLQEINRISFDNYNPFYCILHDDLDTKSNRYWFIYFVDEFERNEFITNFKNAWEKLFQVSFTVEFCKSSEMRKRCIRGVRLIQKIWDNFDETDSN